MAAPLRSLLVAGLLLISISALTAPAGATRTRPKPHKHVLTMDPAQQKLQSGMQEQSAKGGDVQPDQLPPTAPLAPLLPACVPKYATDLVIPPPMPVSLVPMKKEEPASTSKEEEDTRATLADFEGVPVDEYEHPTHIKTQQPLTAAKRKKLQKEFTLDEEYYAFDEEQTHKRRSRRHDDDDNSEYVKKPSKKTSKNKSKKNRSHHVLEDPQDPPVAPIVKPDVPVQDPEAEQVPPPVAVFHSYDISVRQIQQNVFPAAPLAGPGCPANFAPTSVLAYGPANIVGTPFHNWPGFTIEAQHDVPAHIRWTNDLVDAGGRYLPHILRDSIDQTIHWANPTAIGGEIDHNPCHACSSGATFTCASDPACVQAATTTYAGPVPTVTHVHGQANVFDWADGYTEAWYLPAATDLAGFTPVGTWYNTMLQEYTAATGQTWRPGSNTGIYRNTQRASALWYHDHTLGLTRTNVYAGVAGFYLIRDRFPSIANGPELPGIPYPAYDGIIPLNLVRELPLALQDRSFTSDSQLWYPAADNPPGSALPNGALHPRWIPEYTATVPDPTTGVLTNMIMWTVNGRTYPRQTVYPDAYRLRILNGCNSRTVQLRFARSRLSAINPLSATDTANLLPFWVIGNEGGFFPNLQPPMITLQMGPAERYDIIIDFSRLAPGEFVYMLNNGPETDTAIYDGTNNGLGLTVHTAQIMRFDVTTIPVGQTAQPFTLDRQVLLNNALIAQWARVHPIGAVTTAARQVSLLEQIDPVTNLPIAVLLGVATNIANGINTATPTLWMDPVTTNSATSTSYEWDIINLSADSHPIHLHHVDFEYRGRFALAIDPANPTQYVKTNTPVINQDLDPLLEVPCTSNPTGRCATLKDTLLVLPGSYTRIAFNTPAQTGLYVWHCHLVEHEDNEMMVPHCFGQPNYLNPKTGLLMCPGPN